MPIVALVGTSIWLASNIDLGQCTSLLSVQPTRFHPVTILIIEIIEKKNLWQFDNVSYRFRKREAEKRIEKEV